MTETLDGVPLSIAIVMTVFNRREKTLACLARLSEQVNLQDHFTLSATVVDDASTDGTAAAIASQNYVFPVEVIECEGGLFWARGMARAQNVAVAANPDLILWLNDDVELDNDAVSRLGTLARSEGLQSIVVGATRSASSLSITYTGARRRSKRPGSLVAWAPQNEPVSVDAFNGNCVLIPRNCYTKLGGVDPRYEHAYGDIDYGLRATAAGLRVILLPGTVGTCEKNSVNGTWRDPALRRLDRLRGLFGRKGYPIRSHWIFNTNHGGALGFVFFLATYIRALVCIVARKPIGELD